MKKKFYCEVSYLMGLVLLAFGASLMTRADFGLSMIVAPAFIMSKFFSFMTFGMAEYLFQAILLVLLVIFVQRFKFTYLLSFFTAVLYGIMLDGYLYLLSFLGEINIVVRISFYLVGLFTTSLGVAFMFHTYLSAEVYELFVKEATERFGWKLGVVKTTYDVMSFVLAVVMSFVFFGFGHFKGIGLGTLICALVNGKLISTFGSLLEKRYEFVDLFPLRKYF
ncbi:MAG: hypothetical protein IJE65_00735 [Clostridia bacterium]|nr:hypothetical protein [Clostridia bacterium]